MTVNDHYLDAKALPLGPSSVSVLSEASVAFLFTDFVD